MITASPTLCRVPAKEAYFLKEFFLLADFYSKSLDRTFTIKVPAGLVCDGASIPRFLWRLIGHPLMSALWIPFVIHDFLYGCTNLRARELRLERWQVDLLFYDLLKDQGVGWVKANAIYCGVRSFGWAFFRKKENSFYSEVTK